MAITRLQDAPAQSNLAAQPPQLPPLQVADADEAHRSVADSNGSTDTPTPPDSKPHKAYPGWVATSDTALATHTIHAYLEPHSYAAMIPQMCDASAPIRELGKELREQIDAVNSGDMAHMEAVLVEQAYTLNAIFHRLAARAERCETLRQFETDLKLALRAQSQCRATIETLSTVKNPPAVAFVRQANIANTQQVNNGPQSNQSPATPPPAIDSTSQLEHIHGNYLDTGTATAASRNDPAMAPVGEIHRPKGRGRQG